MVTKEEEKTLADNRLAPRSRTMSRGSAMEGQASRYVYGALVAFSVLFYYRPEDFIPGLDYIPWAKLAAGSGLLALFFGFLSSGKFKLPWVLRVLLLLLAQLTLTIPFALWKGGAFSTVFTKFSKGIVSALLIGMAVVSLRQLRRLLWIQVSAVALVTIFSIALNHKVNGRLYGIQHSILENPNDLAINIAISFPLGMAFMLHARGFRKAIWMAALAFMSLGVVLTYSRSGLIAFLITIVTCVWEYGIKGKRRSLVLVSGIALVLGLGAALSTSHFRARVESVVLGNIEGSGDKNSIEQRKFLLKKSIMVALTHPLFGVGPGCFRMVDNAWVVAHNTYTELAAEGGIPALILFLMAIRAAFKNIALVRKSQHYEDDPEFRLFTQALWAGLAAYLAGGCFASTEYNLYPYFMIGYTCAMVRIVGQPVLSLREGVQDRGSTKTTYGSVRRPQPIWTR